MSQQTVAWWGRFELPVGTRRRWRVGPLHLAVENRDSEWLVACRGGEDGEVSITAPEPATGPLPIAAGVTRFFLGTPRDRLDIIPLLADRPVVSHPADRVLLPPGEQVVLFVSSPLWLRLEAAEPAVALQELPLQRPSDTWFGPPTRAGGLCYAGVTRARSRLEGPAVSPHRAITPVLIRNGGRSGLDLDRLSLPVPYLTLYQGEGGGLWTQPVTMDREADAEELAVLRLDRGPPVEAGAAAVLTGPRRAAGRDIVIHAFNALFG